MAVRAEMRKRAKAENDIVTFREYVESRGPFATPEAAVSVLMPVANELTRMHDAGKAHLELSPDSVIVENGGLRLREPTGGADAGLAPGFAAPEIYGGGDCGALSDVYSFCALLRYAGDGKAPEDALTRAEAGAGNIPAAYAYAEAYSVTSLRRITEKGMRIDPDRRYGSMQELIYDLMPFNRMQGWRLPTGKPVRSAPSRRRRVRRPVLAAVLCLIAIVVVTIGIVYGGYIRSLSLTMRGQFSEAWKLIPLQQTVKLVDRKYPDYVRAGMALEKGEYAEAAELFSGLGRYRRSEELRQEALYRQASLLAERGEFDEAMALYDQLAEKNYGNSAELARDMHYRKAVRTLQEDKNYEEAYAMFSALAELRHADSADMADETLWLWAHSLEDEGDLIGAYGVLKELDGRRNSAQYAAAVTRDLYAEAQDRYRAGELAGAAERFALLSSHRDSERYLTLIHCKYYDRMRRESGTSWDSMAGTEYLGNCRFSSDDEAMDALLELVWFEDARTILTDSFTREYLTGRWVTQALTYDLKMTEAGKLTFSLPHYRAGDDYVVRDGEVRAYSGDPDDYTAMLILYPVSRTEMEVYCCKDGETYTMILQR